MDESGVVIGSMGVVLVTTTLALGGINNYRNFVQAHASGNQYQASYPNFTGGSAVKWALGIGVTTAVLLAVAETQYGNVAAAMAGLIAATVLFKEGGTAYRNLQNLFGASQAV